MNPIRVKTMRKFLLTALIAVSTAASAHAVEPAQTAFDLLSDFSASTKTSDYIKLQSSIDQTEAMKIDAKFSELFGTPVVQRSGLKVWEVPNETPRSDQAAFTTIMCGPDQKGGIYVSADRRGNKSVDITPGQANKAKPSKARIPAKIMRRSSVARVPDVE